MQISKSRQLAGIVAKYADLSVEAPLPSLDRDFKATLKVAPLRTLARSVAATFRSRQTPPFEDMIGWLYERSSPRRRAEILNALFAAVPRLRRLPPASGWFKGSRTARIRPKDTANIAADAVVLIACSARSFAPRAIDTVSLYCSRRPALLANLDLPARRLLLNTLANPGAPEPVSPESAGQQRSLADILPPVVMAARPSQIRPAPPPTRGIAFEMEQLGEDTPAPPPPPTAPVAAAEPPEEPAPPPRFASVQVFRESSPGARGPELAAEQPLQEKRWYQLEVSVRLKPVGIPSAGPRRAIREPKQSAPVDILVTAEFSPADFDCPEPVSKLVLPPAGDSTEQASFRLSPLRHSLSASDLLRVRFRLFYKLNLIEMLTVRAEAVSSLDEDSASAFGRSPAIDLSEDRLRQADLNDFDLVTPAALHIGIGGDGLQFLLTFTLQRAGVDLLAFVAPVSLTVGQLESSIAGVRKSLLEVCSSPTLGAGVDGVDWEFEDHLKTLVKRGGELWTLLFDRGPGKAITVVGDWLSQNPFPAGSKIQVSVEDQASSFVFAWNLLADPSHSAAQAPECAFWGLRYVIEQRPVSVTVPPESPPAGPGGPEIGAMYWKFAETPEQQKFLLALLQQAGKATLALGAPIDDAARAFQVLSSCSSQIIYFYTHGYTGLPDGERFGVTVEDFCKLYEALPADSPTRRAWENLYEGVKRKQYRSDESWIELSFGRLELEDLYQRVKALPARPLVILNMCDSAQMTPSLSHSFIDFFLIRGARAVIGTECSMRPVFADFAGRELLQSLFRAEPIGEALRSLRLAAARRRNLLGLAYTLFGTADAALKPRLLP
jgi:hypothetical protein